MSLSTLAPRTLDPPIAPGKLGFVHYQLGRGGIWHERLLLCQVEGMTWIIMTPDGDIYPEALSSIHFVPCMPGGVPRQLAGKMLYRFEDLDTMHTPAEWAEIFRIGVAEAALSREEGNPALDEVSLAAGARIGAGGFAGQFAPSPDPSAGALVVVPPGPPGPPEGPPTPRGSDVWIVSQHSGHQGAPALGSQVVPGKTATRSGDFALDTIGGGTVVLRRLEVSQISGFASAEAARWKAIAGDDSRGVPGPFGKAPSTLGGFLRKHTGGGHEPGAFVAPDARVSAVRYDEQGLRRRTFEDACGQLEEPDFADWPVEGPRTTRWMCKFILTHGGNPQSRSPRFFTDAKVPEGDRVRHEHLLLMDILQLALEYDQLDISALASFEVLARRVALLEESYTTNPKNPRFEGAEHFSGMGRKTAAVAPDLSKHVATALQAESQITKERRKAREEASLAAGNKK